jgi:hypothetical protein
MRLHHARAFLGGKDGARLQILVNTPIEKLRAAGEIELPKGKAFKTEAEEWEAIASAVMAERETLFAKAANAAHMAQRKDPIGRAWFEGLLDGHGVEPELMRELGREYGALYWGELRQLGIQMPGYDERVGRPNVKRKFFLGGLTDHEAWRYELFENILAHLGHDVRRCLQKLCVDDIWTDGPAWLDRCIQSHRAAKIAKGQPSDPVTGATARGYDLETLDHAITGLKALVMGVGR